MRHVRVVCSSGITDPLAEEEEEEELEATKTRLVRDSLELKASATLAILRVVHCT